MITGPANFDTVRNQKRMNTEDKRLKELNELHEKATKAIIKKLKQARTIDQEDEVETRRLIKSIDHDLKAIYEIEYNNSPFNKGAFKNGISGIIERSARNGNLIPVTKAIEYLKERQKEFKKPIFTSRHKIWGFIQIAEKEAEKFNRTIDKESETLFEFEGGKVINDFQDERIKIYFDEIPSIEIREKLKSNGWRWSPRNKAWQRKNTNNAIYNVEYLLKDKKQ